MHKRQSVCGPSAAIPSTCTNTASANTHANAGPNANSSRSHAGPLTAGTRSSWRTREMLLVSMGGLLRISSRRFRRPLQQRLDGELHLRWRLPSHAGSVSVTTWASASSFWSPIHGLLVWLRRINLRSAGATIGLVLQLPWLDGEASFRSCGLWHHPSSPILGPVREIDLDAGRWRYQLGRFLVC